MILWFLSDHNFTNIQIENFSGTLEIILENIQKIHERDNFENLTTNFQFCWRYIYPYLSSQIVLQSPGKNGAVSQGPPVAA